MDVDSRPHLVEIVAALKEITAAISSATTVANAIDELLTVMAGLAPPDVRCGVTLISQGEPATFAGPGLPPEVLDEVLHANGDGPVMAAVRMRDIVLSPDLTEEQRWPVWSAYARRHGVLGVLSYPFDVDALMLGALNLYAGQANTLVDEVPFIAMLVADHASLLLRVRLRQLAQLELLSQVNEVPTGEPAVERAIGILMAQRGCAPQQALQHLHDAATHLGIGLPAVAERLVRSVTDRAAKP